MEKYFIFVLQSYAKSLQFYTLDSLKANIVKISFERIYKK